MKFVFFNLLPTMNRELKVFIDLVKQVTMAANHIQPSCKVLICDNREVCTACFRQESGAFESSLARQTHLDGTLFSLEVMLPGLSPVQVPSNTSLRFVM